MSEESHGENEVSVVLTNGATFTFKFYNGEKGEQGERGYGISNVQLNDDYTLTVTLENGLHFNTPSIRGEKGEQGTGIQSVELRDDYSLFFTLDNGKTLETTAILGEELENIRTLEASASSASKTATSASASALASAQSASEASISASKSASNASQSATNAQESASSASTSADTATSKATEASTSATKAKESETNAKLSETNASNSAKEAKASADSVANVVSDVSQLKEDIANSKEAIEELNDKKITKFYASNLGKIHITDSDNGKIQDMMIYGKSLQNGTPTPDNPIEIQSVVNPKLSVSNGDETLTQETTLPYTLNAIPVSSGGNVTINGKQYIADYVDIENKKLVRNVRLLTAKSPNYYGDVNNIYLFRFDLGIEKMGYKNNGFCNLHICDGSLVNKHARIDGTSIYVRDDDLLSINDFKARYPDGITFMYLLAKQ